MALQKIRAYSQVVRKLRAFFQDELGFVEVPSQNRLSILAACEDPSTISVFNFSDTIWPLPQTGQMWLEVELLKNPKLPGVFCSTTSYRNEPNPIEGRHEKIFPMFEFESHGSLDDLRNMEARLLKHLGLPAAVQLEYEAACKHYGVDEIHAVQEMQMIKDFGAAVSLERFPQRTSPFWNMRRDPDGLYQKIDVILCGMETIGSAERAINPDEMRETFHTISGGEYAALLFAKFGKERVMAELDAYLKFKFFPRFGAGIGVTRLMRAMEECKLIAPE